MEDDMYVVATSLCLVQFIFFLSLYLKIRCFRQNNCHQNNHMSNHMICAYYTLYVKI